MVSEVSSAIHVPGYGRQRHSAYGGHEMRNRNGDARARSMDMWEWRSGERWVGVSVDEERALQAAEDHLAVGETAHVERVRAFLSFHTMSSFYVPTGQAWTATRESAGAVTWRPASLTACD